MYLELLIRNLARSIYWQRVYRASKECNGIHLFENTSNLTGIQITFLYWLEIYDLLYKELSQKEWDILNEEVIKDDIRCDAFLYWRLKTQQKEYIKYKEDMKNLKKTNKSKGNQRGFAIYNGKGT